MLEEIKKGMLAGLGAVVLSKEKVHRITTRLVEEAKLSPEDAEKLADEILATGERQWADLESSIRDAMRKSLDHLDICRGSELEGLRRRVRALETRLSLLEKSSRE